MKIQILILLFLLPTFLFGQIQIDIKIDNYCINPIDSFVVGINNSTDKTFEEFWFEGDTGTVIIPQDKFVFCVIGFYRNNLEYQAETPWPTFNHVRDYKYKQIIIPAYKLMIGSIDFWNSDYYHCDQICSGKIVDTYKNGNKRLEGRFNKGSPKIIKYYNKDGDLLKTEKYNRQGNLIKTVK